MIEIVFGGEFDPTFLFSVSGLGLGVVIGGIAPLLILDKFGDTIFDTHNKEVRRRQKLWDDFRKSHNYNYENTAGKFDAPIEVINKLNKLLESGDNERALELIESKAFTQLTAQCEDELKGIQFSMRFLNNSFHTLFFDIERSYDLEHTDSPLMDKAYPLSDKSEESA